MSANTLTDSQAEMLRTIRDADATYRYVGVYDGSESFVAYRDGRLTRLDGCWALQSAGWVALRPAFGRYAEDRVSLTPAGREALARHEGGDRNG